MMSITLFKENYEFHLASRIENGTPGDYLTGEILLPEHSDSSNSMTVNLSCVMEDQDAPHPCYLHPLLFNKESKRIKDDKGFLDLKMKQNEEDIIDNFKGIKSEGVGLKFYVKRPNVFMKIGEKEEFLKISEVKDGKIKLDEDEGNLRVAIIKPKTKPREKSVKREVKQALPTLRVKVELKSTEDGDLNLSEFSRVVKNKTEKEPRKRKIEKSPNEMRGNILDKNFAGYPVKILGSYVNIDSPALEPDSNTATTERDNVSITDSDIPLRVLDDSFIYSVLHQPEMNEDKEDSSRDSSTGDVYQYPIQDIQDLKDIEVSDLVMLPKELPIYFLKEILVDQNIEDFDMEQILFRIRLTASSLRVYETFGDSWRSGTPITNRIAKPTERLILHKMGGVKLSDAGFEEIKKRRAQGEILKYLPANISDSDLRRLVGMCTLSRTLFYHWECSRCVNYVLFIGRKGPIIWRVSNPATHHPISVAGGNSTSISAMVQVDDNLKLDEEAFRFLLTQIKKDLPGMELPGCLMTYHDWLESIGRDRPASFEVSNMKNLKKIFNAMKLSS